MSVRFRSLTAGTALALASVTAFAAGDHDHAHDHKPLHGGVVTEVRDVDYELVVQPAAAQLYLRDHGKQVNVSNTKAKLTLLTGSQKQEVQLTPAADGSRLEGSGTFAAAKGTKAVVLHVMNEYMAVDDAQGVRLAQQNVQPRFGQRLGHALGAVGIVHGKALQHFGIEGGTPQCVAQACALVQAG